MDRKPLELYLHIPFCVQKCRYCDFLSFPTEPSDRKVYLDVLKQEIREKGEAYESYRVSTIFIGGGTPSLLTAIETGELMETVAGAFTLDPEAEITIECNPGTINREKLLLYQKCGINRLSIGVQSTNNRELELLGRIHTYEEFLESYDQARRVGFENINVDLITGLPGQTVKDVEKSLVSVLGLRPEHISVYSLTIEQGTRFFELYGIDEETRRSGGNPLVLPSEETEREMYHRTEELLLAQRYKHYEISNYAKPGFECRHNLGYWDRNEYLGLGLGASSLVDETRFHNTPFIEEYLKRDFERKDEEKLKKKGRMEEFMFLGLRKIAGVLKSDFYGAFGRTIHQVYGPVLERLYAEGLLEETSDRVFLTERGLDLANYVMSGFLLD